MDPPLHSAPRNSLNDSGIKSMLTITVSDLHGEVKPVEAAEPPVKPQPTEIPSPEKLHAEAKVFRKLSDRMKGVVTHFLYLGMYI